MNRFLKVCLGMTALAAMPAQADTMLVLPPTTGVLTLEQARDIALHNHPLLHAAQLTQQAAAEGVNIARSTYYPQVGVDGVRAFASAGTRIAATGGLNDPTVLDRGSLGVGASQLITDFGRREDIVDSARLELDSERQRTESTGATVILEVTQAYFNVLRAQTLLRVANDTVRTRQTLLEQVQTLHSSKLRSDLDLSIAQQGVADADLLRLRARTGVDDAYATLTQALGLPTQVTLTLAETRDGPPPPNDLAGMLSQAVHQNPDLQAAAAAAAAAHKSASAEDKARYPTISALGYAGVSPQRDPAGVLHSNYGTAGVVLDLPLFTGGRLEARARQAELKASALDETYDDIKNRLLRDIRIAYGNAQAAFKNISVTDQLQRNAHTTLDLTQTRYNIGASSIVDLNQAQLAVTQAEIEHAEAIFVYRTDLAVLNYRTGQPDTLDN